jgi:nucleoside-diphosphate-sugar epimerase
MMPPRGPLIALTGGTGFVGQALLDEAARTGVEVRALARRRMEPMPGVDWVRGDLDDRDALAMLMRDAEAVVHVAGVVNAPDLDDFFHANVLGTLTMLEAALKAGVRRFIYVSSSPPASPNSPPTGPPRRLQSAW